VSALQHAWQVLRGPRLVDTVLLIGGTIAAGAVAGLTAPVIIWAFS